MGKGEEGEGKRGMGEEWDEGEGNVYLISRPHL
jgi:hypothetical protein